MFGQGATIVIIVLLRSTLVDGGAASLRSALVAAPLPRDRTLIVRSFVSDIIHTSLERLLFFHNIGLTLDSTQCCHISFFINGSTFVYKRWTNVQHWSEQVMSRSRSPESTTHKVIHEVSAYDRVRGKPEP